MDRMVVQMAGDGADGDPPHFTLWIGREAGRADAGMVLVCAVPAEVCIIRRISQDKTCSLTGLLRS